MAHLYSLFDFYIPYGNFNFILVLVLKFPASLNLSFHNLSIYQFSRKNTRLAQFIPRIYNKIIIKILGYFRGVTQKVKPRSYMPGDLVLKKLLLARKNPAHGKLGPNWEGPYIISRVIRPGNYELQTEEGKILHHAWNAEHLERFY